MTGIRYFKLLERLVSGGIFYFPSSAIHFGSIIIHIANIRISTPISYEPP